MLPADLAQERQRVLLLVSPEKEVEAEFLTGKISHEYRLIKREEAALLRKCGVPALAQSYAEALSELTRLRGVLEVYAAAEMWQFIGPSGQETLTRVNNDLARSALAPAPEVKP